MITKEMIQEANRELASIPLKGKSYVMVNERVKKFREICPAGSIYTEILSLQDGTVVIQARIADEEGNVVATGIASENNGSSFINKTSFIENCETSAVGRALGFLGIGVDASMASAEEVANAMLQQDEMEQKKNTISKTQQSQFVSYAEKIGADWKAIGKEVGATSLQSMTNEQHGLAMAKLMQFEKESKQVETVKQ